MCWLVEVVQEAVEKPLCLDTPNPVALAAALKVHRGKALVNSITAQKERHAPVLPLLKAYGCGVIVLCLGEGGVPDLPQERADLAGQLIALLTEAGIAPEDIYIDPLVHAVSTASEAGRVTLETIGEVKRRYPAVRTVCGISNVSFGLPARKRLNRVFLLLALQKGLDAALLDPTDPELKADLMAAEALLGKDEFCRNYLSAYRAGKL